MNLLITGGTGFVGQYLVKELLNQGHNLKVISRREPTITSENLTHIRLDLLKDNISSDLLNGVDIVIHLAFHRKEFLNLAYHSNISASKRLIKACEEARIKKFIFFSSVKVMGETTSYEYDEKSPPNPQTIYAKQKKAIEDLLARSSLNYVTIRLPPVYGTGTKIGIIRIFKILRYFKYIPYFTNQNKKSLIHVKDVVNFTVNCVKNNKINRETFIITDNKVYSTKEILSILVNKSNSKIKLVIDKQINILLKVLIKKLNSKIYNMLYASSFYSCKKAMEMLNFSPQYNLYNTDSIY